MRKQLAFMALVMTLATIHLSAVEPRPSFGLKVTRTKDKKASMDDSVTTEHVQTLNIDLRNTRGTPGTVLVQWLFLAKPARGKADKFVYDYDGDTITVPGHKGTNIVARSKKIESESWSYIGNFGATPHDWVVALIHNERILKVKASNAPLERKCRTYKGFVEVLDTHKEE